MISSDDLCMSCMREIGSAKVCPHCGYHADTAQISPYLPVRTVIVNRYLVGKMLEYNGEGATYIGWDLRDKKAVKIREFIPDSFTTRTPSSLQLQIMTGGENTFYELLRSFVEMWTKLARLKGLSALISVNEVVEDYGTAYAIYDHFEGITLRDFLLRNKVGYIPWEKARQLLMPLLSTLVTLHSSGIIHRGISPSTLVIGLDGKIRLTGFCIGEARTARSDLNSQIFDGYAAIEQYGFEGQQGTWTDIYAFASVLYRTLIGSDPIPATERVTNDRLMVPGKFAEALPAYVINGLINALQILPEDRTRTVEQLRAELSASPAAAAAGGAYQRNRERRPAPQKQSGGKKPPEKKGSGNTSLILKTAGICIAVGLVLLIAAYFVFLRDKPDNNTNSSTTVSEQTELVQVPNFLDSTYLDVESNSIFTSNFNFVAEKEYNSNVVEGYIFRQSIEPDSMVEKGTTITLTVSAGQEKIPLPDVVGSQYEEAEQKLTELGFVCDRMDTPSAPGSAAENEIISMAPLSGKTYVKGTTVYLKVFVPVTEEETTEEETSASSGYDMPQEDPWDD